MKLFKVILSCLCFLLFLSIDNIYAQVILGPSGVIKGSTYYYSVSYDIPMEDVTYYEWFDVACGDCFAGNDAYDMSRYIFNTIGIQDVEWDCCTTSDCYGIEFISVYVFGLTTNPDGSKTLSRKSGDNNYYWQTSVTGTDKSATAAAETFLVMQPGTYHLRYWNSYSSSWSKTYSVDVSICAVRPPSPSVSTNTCGNKTLARGTPPTGFTWYWQGTNSNGTSTSNSSTTYSASSSGTYYLRARNNTTGCWSSSTGVSVSVNPSPAKPTTPSVSTNTCGNKTLTRGTPPTGVTWYWQGTNSGGTSTTNLEVAYPINSSGTYYIRARNNTTGCWSSATGVTVTINAIPASPSTPTVSTNTCGNRTLTRGTPPSGITWYWQGTNSGGTSTSNSSTTYSAGSSGTYYIRARNNTTGCWSSSTGVSATVNAVPTSPTTPTVSTNNCGSKTLTRGTPPTGITWYWQGTSSGGTSTANSATTYSASSSGTYYIRARNNTTGCWSSSTGVSVTVNSIPASPTTPTVSTNTCGNKTLTRGTPPTGITWYWQGTSSGGTSTTNSATAYSASSSGTYYIRARNNTTGCWSSSTGVNVTVNSIPASPTTPTVSTNTCGNKTLTKGTPPTGITWYWQGTNSGGTSTTNSSITYTASSSGMYYIRARNNTSGCWSGATSVSVTVNPIPAVPTQPTVSDNIWGDKTLTRGTPPTGITWYWQGINSSGTDTGNSGSTFIANISGTYYLRARNETNGCWSAPTSVALEVYVDSGPDPSMINEPLD